MLINKVSQQDHFPKLQNGTIINVLKRDRKLIIQTKSKQTLDEQNQRNKTHKIIPQPTINKRMNISSYMPIQKKLKIADMSKKKKTIRFSFPRIFKF